MEAKLKRQLETTKKICEHLLAGETFDVSNSEIDCVPGYLNVMTKTKAKKAGLVLKRGAEPVGRWTFRVGGGVGNAQGDLYLGSKFKPMAEGDK